MTVYRMEVASADPEVESPPRMPLWDGTDLPGVMASFHEWMGYALTHEQRLATRFTLTEVAEGN